MWLRIRPAFGLNDQILVQTSFLPRTQALPSELQQCSWWQQRLESFWIIEHDEIGLDQSPDLSLSKRSTSCVNASFIQNVSGWKKYSSSMLHCSPLPPDTNLSCLRSRVPWANWGCTASLYSPAAAGVLLSRVWQALICFLGSWSSYF